MLSKVVNEYHTDWDFHLQTALFAYRTAVHESTDHTPFHVVFGRAPTLPVDIMLGRQSLTPDEYNGLSAYVKRVQSSLSAMFAKIRERQKAAHQQNKTRFDKKVAGIQFCVGDCVRLHIPSNKKGTSKKFGLHWRGPYTVVDKLSVYNYRIQLIGTTKTQVVHRNRLKLCFNDMETRLGSPGSTTELPPTSGGFATLNSTPHQSIEMGEEVPDLETIMEENGNAVDQEPPDITMEDDHNQLSSGDIGEDRPDPHTTTTTRPKSSCRPRDHGPYIMY
jgi:hypothetical protein